MIRILISSFPVAIFHYTYRIICEYIYLFHHDKTNNNDKYNIVVQRLLVISCNI